MKRKILFSVLALGAFGLSISGNASAADLPVVAWQGRTMGSDYTVKLVDAKLTDPELAALKTEIEKTLAEVNHQMSNYQPESELSRFNQTPENTPFKISPDFARVIRFSLELSRMSDGAFDPTLGPLINLWGFGEKTSVRSVPPDAELKAAMAKTGWQHVTVSETGELSKDIPGLAVDLGAVAKGFGVDQMIRVLQAHGYQNIYASIAGEVRVLGHNPRGAKWMLGISLPKDLWRENDPMAAAVNISNQAISTSGDYQKFFVDDKGRRLCHIINGKTGTPVQHHVAAVTIVAPDSMTADGYSTTTFVLGPEEGLKFIESRPNAAALFILREKDGSFRPVASSKFEALTGYKP